MEGDIKEGLNLSYELLKEKYPNSFHLMENTANALLLEFDEPLKYDLRIPKFSNIKTLVNMWADYHKGINFDVSKVDCVYPSGSYGNEIDKEIHFYGGIPERIEKGINLCLKKRTKNDSPSLETHLLINEDIFGYEKGMYRFREGQEEKISSKVSEFFSLDELKVFDDFGNFVKHYIKRLDLPHLLDVIKF